ncbi:hypothetical protein [Legionella parisiensis]|uniref:Uncharacterized protein n=1 Tax=Legionella parisiensis TaxID=45071 RepID=A0A1E5JQS0_9GAMM|nr:hypothetical protein [Legionella parisiensis]KTD41562.1 hypothetical protein Lpar_2879 [Legionella parisiensis]OEH46861.1 hypothetical protein lpari_02063 [Legionella parisiensis]STX76120.1 Uncharacterised protein [Legionella parisiensis]
MHNINQQNQNPFDELACEMLLEIFNARNKDKNYILKPSDMVSVALSCKRFNGISQNANCFFLPHTYKELREKASDYHNYKENQLAKLRLEQRLRHEKNGPFYWNKRFRNRVAFGLGFLLASLLALKLDLSYETFLLTNFILATVTMIVIELIMNHLEFSLDISNARKIPLQFFEEEIASIPSSLSL